MRKFGILFVFLMMGILAAKPAQAQVTLTLLNDPLTIVVGGSGLMTATLTNPVGGAPQELTGLSLRIDSPLTTDDGALFFLNFPAVLNGGESVTNGIFTVSAPLSTPIGSYTGTVTLLDGDTPLTPDTPFNVNVTAASVAQEPAVIALCVPVFAVLFLRRRIFG